MPAAKAEEAPRAVRHGWIIQVGAYEDEAEAKQRLTGAEQGGAAARQGRGLHREDHQGRQDLLPRPLRRASTRPGRSRLSQAQAQ